MIDYFIGIWLTVVATLTNFTAVMPLAIVNVEEPVRVYFNDAVNDQTASPVYDKLVNTTGPIDIIIQNNNGGSVATMNLLIEAIKKHKGEVTLVCVNTCISAAGVILLEGDKLRIYKKAEVSLHLGSYGGVKVGLKTIYRSPDVTEVKTQVRRYYQMYMLMSKWMKYLTYVNTHNYIMGEFATASGSEICDRGEKLEETKEYCVIKGERAAE